MQTVKEEHPGSQAGLSGVRRVHRLGGGGGFAGIAEAFFAASHNGIARPAAQRLLAADVEIVV